MNVKAEDLANMEQRRRARFINSLSGFKSANLIGSCDAKKHLNLSIVSSVFHLGADPALMGFIVRPSSVERHTLDNILTNQCYTINAVSRHFVTAAHQTSARYPRHDSEFEKVGLSAAFIEGFPAPFVEQSPLRLGMRLVEHQTLNVNQTELVIGEICHVHVSDKAVMQDGYIDVESLGLVAVSGLDSYHVTNRIGRFSYAKPGSAPTPLSLAGLKSPRNSSASNTQL